MLPVAVAPPVPLHGLGGAQDLPVPAWLAITGGTVALAVSFGVLALTWRHSRYGTPAEAERRGRPVPTPIAAVIDSRPWRLLWHLLGLVMAGWFGWALFAGPDLLTNPVFGSFYVLLWVGIIPASLLGGRIYRAMSPVRSLHRLASTLLGRDPGRGLLGGHPRWLGLWPAALGLFAYVWLELAYPDPAYLAPVQTWVSLYLVAMVTGGLLVGDRWFDHADPFQVYSDLVARLSPWGRDSSRRLVWRSPLANLAAVRPAPGLGAVVAVLFGSTAFDSISATVGWSRLVNDSPLAPMLTATLTLFALCLLVGTSFMAATTMTAIDPPTGTATAAVGPAPRRSDLPALIAHSVVPIIVGYMVAHYLSYFVEFGQLTLTQLSDPMVTGADLLGTADWPVNYWLSQHPSVLADIKVIAVVLGHIVGATAAHDRALTVLPARQRVTGQLALLVVMLAYTGVGLYLLFSV